MYYKVLNTEKSSINNTENPEPPQKFTQTPKKQPIPELSHKIGTDPKMLYCRGMNNTTQMQTYTDPCTYAMQNDMNRLKEEIASDLANYMLEMMPPLEMCVDFVCDRFGLDCTYELIDFVADCHDEFFGN
jgi:hypothetical protein